MFVVFAASDRHPVAFPRVRGVALLHLHVDHAGHPADGHLERRDGHRTAEEGDVRHEAVALEKSPDGDGTVLDRLVFALHAVTSGEAEAQQQLLLLCVRAVAAAKRWAAAASAQGSNFQSFDTIRTTTAAKVVIRTIKLRIIICIYVNDIDL